MNVLGLTAAIAMFGLAPAAMELPQETAAISRSPAATTFDDSCQRALRRMGMKFGGLGGPLAGCTCVARVVTDNIPDNHQAAALEALVIAILARNVTDDHRSIVYQRLRDIRVRHKINEGAYQQVVGNTAKAIRACS